MEEGKGREGRTQDLLAMVGVYSWLGTGIWGQVCGNPTLLMSIK